MALRAEMPILRNAERARCVTGEKRQRTPTWGFLLSLVGWALLGPGVALAVTARLVYRAQVVSHKAEATITSVRKETNNANVSYCPTIRWTHGRFRRAGTSFDFDAIELFNGYRDAERQHAGQVLQDWFNLIDHGYRFTATGNSDTHHLRFNLGGFPRNYLRVADDRPEAMTPDLLARTVKAGRCFFTTGPFVSVDVGGGQEGDTVRAENGHVPGTITVQAAPWVDVSSVTLFVDGRAYRHWAVPAARTVERFAAHFDVNVERDAYVVVRVQGRRPLTPVVGEPTWTATATTTPHSRRRVEAARGDQGASSAAAARVTNSANSVSAALTASSVSTT